MNLIKVFIIFLCLLIFNGCGGSTNDHARSEKVKTPKTENTSTSSDSINFISIYEHGKDNFYNGDWRGSTNIFDQLKFISHYKKYNYQDTLISFYSINISDTLSSIYLSNSIDSIIIKLYSIKLFNLTLLNSQSLANLIELLITQYEIKQKYQRLDEKYAQDKIEKEIRSPYDAEANSLISYYTSLINGKSYNRIGDILYDDGFLRDFSYSSVSKTNYSKSFSYDKGSINLKISVWYSYGYGSLYFDISYYLIINGKYYFNY